MKKIIPIIAIATSLTATAQLANAKIWPQPTTIVNDIDVRDFTGIASGGPIQVIVTLSNTEDIRFEGDKDAIATLVTEVKNGILVIRPKTSWESWAHKYDGKSIKAYVNAKHLSNITMSGNGSLSVKGQITGSSLNINLSGSGSIWANADVSDLNVVMSGSGKLNLTGSADATNIVLSGSASFTKKEFETNSANIKISGSGKVYLTASDDINALISGSGTVYYSGNPEITKRVLGSGGVKQL